jgi:hypothetical protein
MKFFNVDLHISIIADMTKIFNELGHEVTDWSLSDHTWVFNKKRASIPILDNGQWRNMSPHQFSDLFYENYKDKLKEYDAFIVTYPPPFALLYKHFNKPIIINNPIRYEWPFSFRKDDWNYFNDFLRDGVDNNQIYLIANNLYDKKYMEDYIDREVTYIPSICDYYEEYYEPKNDSFIYYSKGKINGLSHGKIKHKDEIFKSHRHKDLTHFKGIIHFPYQISYMSIFEQYTANIPLLVPDINFLLDLYKSGQSGILKELSWPSTYNRESKSVIQYKGIYDPNDYKNFDSVYHWIQYSDFYNEEWMPYIVKFSNLDNLKNLVEEIDTNDISDKMSKFNIIRKEKIYKLWQNFLNKIV